MTQDEENRVSMEIPVRVFGMDSASKPFSKPAHTINIGKSAVRLGGVDVALRVEDIIGVQYGNEKARFRVVAIGSAATPQVGDVELCCIQPEKNIWGNLTTAAPAPVKQAPVTKQEVPPATSHQNRRQFERYKCEFGIIAQPEAGGDRSWGRCTDLSKGGCYIETWSPATLGSMLSLTLEGMVIKGMVCAFHPNVGMGIRFLSVSNPAQLDSLLLALSETLLPK